MALLVLAAALLPRLLQVRQPRVLLVYWRMLLGVSLMLPFVQPWHRPLSIPVMVISTEFERPPIPPPSSPTPARWHLPDLQAAAQVAGVVILAGIVMRFAILALGLLKLRRLRRASAPFSQSVESAAALEEVVARVETRAEFRLSSEVDSPVTFGLSSPLILLPERFPSLEPRFQAAIACHELLHVRRRDWAQHLGEEFLRATFWFHPAIAWLISRIRLAREQVVDVEVVTLTQARKPYLEALLEFTNSRAFIAAIPAPPFLAERQLVERVSLMLKEVRMSRRRLVVSLVAVSCSLMLVLFFAARMFPLRAAPLPAQDTVKKDVAHRVSGALSGGIADGVSAGVVGGISSGVSGGVPRGASGGASGGVPGGIEGGINGDNAKRQRADEPAVDYSTIWTDTVKRGPMIRQVVGLGQLIRAENSSDLIARVTVPESFGSELRPNESATILLRPNQKDAPETRGGPIKGQVIRVSPTPGVETQTVDIALNASREFGFTAGLQVEAAINIEKIDDTLYVGRPANIPANATPFASASEFKIVNDGKNAERVVVKLGKPSANTIQVLGGLEAGDKIILSDMSAYDSANRLHLTDNTHVVKH